MAGMLHRNWIGRFLLMIGLMVVCSVMTPASAAVKSGTWQTLNSTTSAINGTVPLADGVTIPVYQGSIQLNADETNVVSYSAKPRDFSTDDNPSSMTVVNANDAEGDIFAVPPLRWESQAPSIELVWADAQTPEEPLNPQPAANKTFCEQNMAGRAFVVWPKLETDTSTTAPALYLQTTTGTPFTNTVSLLSQKIPVTIAAAVDNPVSIVAEHYDDTLKAAKVKAGESITLTVTTHDCQGAAVGNAAFVITRGDALNRQGEVNNSAPIRVGDTELTTTATKYHGTTDANGNATITVTQDNGPGVKTLLTVSPTVAPQLSASIGVIFTTLTSPDSPSANMWGHMAESGSAELEGETYTFSRPVLAAEADGENGTVMANNERWALFNWKGADAFCDILPDARQLMGLKVANVDLATSLGWPVAGNNEYWSSSEGTLAEYHLGVNMLARSVVDERDSTASLVSCVDKSTPAVTPVITLAFDNMNSALNAAKAPVGNAISMTVSLRAQETGKALPYRYFDLYLDDEQNRKGQTNAEARAENAKYGWDDNPVLVGINGSGTPEHYHGITGADGKLSIQLTQNEGAGVLTPLRVVLSDGTQASANVIFTVVTSPNTEQARMWGHMQGVVEAGNIYKRPLLASEASANTGSTIENHEDWATFNSVAAATSQCGVGRVPGQHTLDTLYSAHPSNGMLTTYGWPTAEHSYISADIEGSTTAQVSLSSGADSTFTGSEPNYLTCSGNELVTQLAVWLNDDVSSQKAAAKVGEKIAMHVRSTNVLNGLTVPNAAFTITMAHGKNRSGLTTGYTDPSNGALMMDGVSYGESQSSVTYQGTTDAEGNATVDIEQPEGVGLLTALRIAPVDSLITTSLERSVTFTVPTSPDTPKAQMWGHMADTVAVGSLTFMRPKLAAEVTATRTQEEDNETWARISHSDAAENVTTGGCPANRLPRIDQLSALYSANSNGAIHSAQGWPVAQPYWSATLASSASWQMLSLSNGANTAGSNGSVYTSCLSEDNPIAATIKLEPVDAAQWSETYDAAKVKKGDTLQLKVTVSDANGTPLPGTAFVLSRGDGYTRQGTRHVAGSGDGIVSAVVIDGESLSDTATRIGRVTGSDGSTIISVTRPDTSGTKVAITAALNDNASVSDSIDTIFTVVTSPDSSKAAMWGHMPETVTAANGKVFQRPKLLSEITTGSVVGTQENNEAWGTADAQGVVAACGAAYVPTLADLQSLYNANPGGKMGSQQGWALDEKNYQSSSIDLTRSTENRYIKSLSMLDNAMTSQLWSEKLYFACLQEPHAVATQLRLTSSLYNDAEGFAKAKVGDTIPVVVTTLDAEGNPVGNVPVILGRGDSVGRANQDVNASEAALLEIDRREGRAGSAEYYTATGEDGTLSLGISQDGGAGFKTPIRASIDGLSSSTQSWPVIFTVKTSPDTPKANYWGHMPETVTDGDGVVYKRPLLASEFSATPGKTITLANGAYDKGETWGMVTASDAWNSRNGGCGRASLPAINNLQSLYARYPEGAMRTSNGWPLSTASNVSASQFWWSGESVLSDDGNSLKYAAVNLQSSGNVEKVSSALTYYMQTCLATPRILASKVTLTLANQDEATGIAKVEKGQQIAATVTATDSLGAPVANMLVKISRGDALSRAGVAYTANAADDITLTNIQPAGTASFLMDTTAAYLYARTNALGQITFGISQDASVGLKTAIIATAADDATLSDTKAAVYTVLTSPDSDKAQYWGHMPETATNSAGVKFRRPLLAAEMSAYSGTYTYKNEIWPYVTAANAQTKGASGCNVEYQPLMSDMETLFIDNLNVSGGIGGKYGWPTGAYKPWWAADKEAGTGYYQFIILGTGGSGTTNSASATAGQVCLVEPRSTAASITLTSSAMNSAKKAAMAAKGDTVPLTVTVKDTSGNPVANAEFTLARGDSTNRAGIVITDGDVEADMGADDIVLRALTPVSSSVDMPTAASLFSGKTGADGTATFTVSQPKSLGLETPFTAKLVTDTTKTALLNVVFTVPTSPDTDKATYWGDMPDSVSVNGHTLLRPWLLSELPSGAPQSLSVLLNREQWAMAHTADTTHWDLAAQCGSLEQAASLDDLKALHAVFGDTGWPSTTGYAYLSKTKAGSNYSGYNESSGSTNAYIDAKKTMGFATCVQ